MFGKFRVGLKRYTEYSYTILLLNIKQFRVYWILALLSKKQTPYIYPYYISFNLLLLVQSTNCVSALSELSKRSFTVSMQYSRVVRVVHRYIVEVAVGLQIFQNKLKIWGPLTLPCVRCSFTDPHPITHCPVNTTYAFYQTGNYLQFNHGYVDSLGLFFCFFGQYMMINIIESLGEVHGK